MFIYVNFVLVNVFYIYKWKITENDESNQAINIQIKTLTLAKLNLQH